MCLIDCSPARNYTEKEKEGETERKRKRERWRERDILTCGEKQVAHARNSIIMMQTEKCRRQRKE